MKKIILGTMFLALVSMNAVAQIQTPAASPASKLEQKIGLVDVTVEYSRPGKKGRNVFGKDGLVEYGKFWRTGANSVTKITFSDAVKVNGSDLAKGSYAILTKPDAAVWQVYFYPYESSNWNSYTEKTPTTSLEVKPLKSANTFETFTIDLNNFSDNSGTLSFNWENVTIPIILTLETDKVVMASIDKVMAGPSSNDYYNAATYYHTSGKDLNQALIWVQKATKEANPKFWQVRREALILADLGRYKEAIAAAKLSKELAMTAGNDEYVKMNEKSIGEWMGK